MNAISPAIGVEKQGIDIGSPERAVPSCLSADSRLTRHLLLLDPCMMTRECLAHMLETSCPELRIWAAACVEDAPEQPHRLVLLNIRSANVRDREVGQLADDVRARFGDDAPIAIISDRDEVGLQLEAIRHGYRGVIPTSLTSELAIAAVKLMMAGGTFVPNVLISWCAGLEELSYPAMPSASDGLGDSGITDREQQVLNLLGQGKPNKIIAYELRISESTVKVHVRHIMRKLNVTNRTRLAILFQSPRWRAN